MDAKRKLSAQMHTANTTSLPRQREVVASVYQMPRNADGKPRFPSRTDGIEVAVMRGPVGTAKLKIDN